MKFPSILGLPHRLFILQENRSVIISISEKSKRASVSHYRPVDILNAFSKVCEFVIHEHISHHFKTKLHYSQHSFTEPQTNYYESGHFSRHRHPHPRVFSRTVWFHLLWFDSAVFASRQAYQLWLCAEYVNWICCYPVNRPRYLHSSRLFAGVHCAVRTSSRSCLGNSLFT
jgi:hypothetical protein